MADLNCIAEKTAQCVVCSASITYTTSKRKYCGDCNAGRKLESARRAAEKIRRMKGVLPVKGTIVCCIVCGTEFLRLVHSSTRCKPCQDEYGLQSSRLASRTRTASTERRERFNSWLRKKNQTDVGFRLARNVSSQMSMALRRHKAGRSWKLLVDYTLEDLRKHLERQFQKGMSWENYGLWHVDHIVAKSRFKFKSAEDPEFKAAWALANLRPMWGIENIRKQATRTHLL